MPSERIRTGGAILWQSVTVQSTILWEVVEDKDAASADLATHISISVCIRVSVTRVFPCLRRANCRLYCQAVNTERAHRGATNAWGLSHIVNHARLGLFNSLRCCSVTHTKGWKNTPRLSGPEFSLVTFTSLAFLVHHSMRRLMRCKNSTTMIHVTYNRSCTQCQMKAWRCFKAKLPLRSSHFSIKRMWFWISPALISSELVASVHKWTAYTDRLRLMRQFDIL